MQGDARGAHVNSRLEPAQLSRTVISGTLWTYVSFAGSRLFSFTGTMILARLLVPEQFRLMGYCRLALQYLAALMVLVLWPAKLLITMDGVPEGLGRWNSAISGVAD